MHHPRSQLEPPPSVGRSPRHGPSDPPGEAARRAISQGPEPGFAQSPWRLLRRFSEFWPAGLASPPALPWLGELVDRRRAWRWASQFPRFLASVDPTDVEAIRGFVAATLLDVEPSEGEGDGDKRCCRKKPRERYPDFPEEEPEDCWQVTCAESECGATSGFEDSGLEGAGLGASWCAKDCCNTIFGGQECGPCTWHMLA